MESSEGCFFQEPNEMPECIQWLQKRKIPSHVHYSYVTKQSRENFWKCLNNPDSVPEEERAYFQDARRRLDVIFTAGDTATNNRPEGAHVFDENDFPNYTKGSNILHFVHTPYCIQRYQKSRLCYLHAVAMIQYYAIARYRQKNNLPVEPNILDIASFIKHNFDNKKLEKHIFENDGGRSVIELENILQPYSKLKQADVTDISGIVAYLQQYGPGLVSNFLVYSDFENVNEHKHYGPIPEESVFKGKHAMVMVGYKFENGKHIFLLQNWWLKKQFVEVDQEYLIACEPVLHWVVTDQPSIPEKMPTKTGIWLETEAAEFLDGYELEDM